MSTTVKNEFRLVWVRGALEPQKRRYLRSDKTPYDISGKVAKLRLKPHGRDEIVLTGPYAAVTDGPNGEMTIAPTEALLDGTGFSENGGLLFTEAEISLQLDLKILAKGTLTIKNWYD
jgi:hypothetical protein